MATKVKLIETGAVTGNIIPDGGIATGKLADDAVTTIKISDGNITHAKLHTSMDLTGKTVTVATAAGSTNTTAAASTAFVQQELTTLIGGAPSTLDTLNELAAAINDDASYASTLTTALATKLPLAGGTMTGDLITTGLTVDTTTLVVDKTNNRVGIGTTSPDALLDIEKAASGTSFVPYLQLGQTYTVANSKYGIDFKNTEYSWNQGRISVERQGSASNFDMILSSASGGSLVEGIRIDHAGNVGIGTTAPTAQFQVSGNSYLIGNGYGIYGNADYANYSIATSGAGGVLDINWYGGIKFLTSGNVERMRLTSTGLKVGYGTAAAITDLDVHSDAFGLPPTSGTGFNGMFRIGYNDGRVWNGNEIVMGIINAGAQDYAGYIQCKVPSNGAATRPFLINPQGGKVGIGTDTPANARLVISDTGSNKISIDGGSSQNGMRWEAVGGANTFYLYNGTSGTAGFGLYNVNTTATPLWIQNSGHTTINGPLAVDSNATVIDTNVAGGNFVAGCAADTFHEITNIDWNGYFTTTIYR